MPRGSAAQARTIAGGLGMEILRSIAISGSQMSGEKRIDELSAGTVKVVGGVDTPRLHKQIADRVENALLKRFD